MIVINAEMIVANTIGKYSKEFGIKSYLLMTNILKKNSHHELNNVSETSINHQLH